METQARRAKTESRPQITPRRPRVHDESEPRSPTIRSAVSNGTRLHAEADGRSVWSRRYRDLILVHISDMGGRSILSEAQIALIKRASTLEVELERMEGRLSEGEPVDLDKYGRAAGNLRRILQTLGLKRELREINPLEDDECLRIYREELNASSPDRSTTSPLG
jgi:hypothetical protein